MNLGEKSIGRRDLGSIGGGNKDGCTQHISYAWIKFSKKHTHLSKVFYKAIKPKTI